MAAPTRILIADDSALFVEAFQEALAHDPGIIVVGVARTGKEAVEMTARLRPDLVTMDLHMPEGGGLAGVEGIMSTHPTPILVLTGDPNAREASTSFEALSRGALELVPKPQLVDVSREELEALREHLKFLARLPVFRSSRRRARPTVEHLPAKRGPRPIIVGIVASTGGPSTLADLLAGLPADFPAAVVVVQHLAAGFVQHLAHWLQGSSALKVLVASHGMAAGPGQVLLAPDSSHLEVDCTGRIRLDRTTPALAGNRPSGDVLLSSLARNFGPRAAGMILTGMGRDGSAGLVALHRAGGVTLAQDGASASIDGMPAAARETGAVDFVVPRDELAETLLAVVTHGRRAAVPPMEAR